MRTEEGEPGNEATTIECVRGIYTWKESPIRVSSPGNGVAMTFMLSTIGPTYKRGGVARGGQGVETH